MQFFFGGGGEKRKKDNFVSFVDWYDVLAIHTSCQLFCCSLQTSRQGDRMRLLFMVHVFVL